jgi:hypothetical protein
VSTKVFKLFQLASRAALVSVPVVKDSLFIHCNVALALIVNISLSDRPPIDDNHSQIMSILERDLVSIIHSIVDFVQTAPVDDASLLQR